MHVYYLWERKEIIGNSLRPNKNTFGRFIIMTLQFQSYISLENE